MKTAIQKLIDFIESTQLPKEGAANCIYEKAKELLQKEKEQIKKAFSDGQETPINHPTLPHYSKEEYYNDNFNQFNSKK